MTKRSKIIPDAGHIIAMTNQGRTRGEIAERFGLTESAVRHRQKRLGVKAVASRRFHESQPLEWTPVVQTLWDSRLTVVAIADLLNVPLHKVYLAARKQGLPRRGRMDAKPLPGSKPKPAPRELTPLERMRQMARAESRAHRAYTEARA